MCDRSAGWPRIGAADGLRRSRGRRVVSSETGTINLSEFTPALAVCPEIRAPRDNVPLNEAEHREWFPSSRLPARAQVLGPLYSHLDTIRRRV